MVKRSTVCAASFLIWATIGPGSAPAGADPIPIGGSIMPSTIGLPSYQWTPLFLDGSFFIANIPRPLTPAEQLCTPCAPGQVLDLSTTFSFSATGLFFDPEGFGLPAFGEAQLTYTSAPITVPVSLPGSIGFGLQFPLTATGFIRIIDSETSVLIDNAVFGSGRGLLFLTGTGADVPYSFSSVNYSLADPVPEPGSLLLTSLGALYLARQVRRRRRDGVDRSGA